jgi:hypothetical protein
MELSLLTQVFFYLTAIVFVSKTVHFVARIKRKKLFYWFYFDSDSIVNSRSLQSAKAKKLQNIFSVLLFIFVLVTALVALLNYQMEHV